MNDQTINRIILILHLSVVTLCEFRFYDAKRNQQKIIVILFEFIQHSLSRFRWENIKDHPTNELG